MIDHFRGTQPRERDLAPVAAVLSDGSSPATEGRNRLVREILDNFCPRFTPAGTVIAVGDSGGAVPYVHDLSLQRLGVALPEHRKLPNVVIHQAQKNRLVIVEAATDRGPINPGRRDELEELFKGSTHHLIFVTAFTTRRAMAKHLEDIAWDTEVWLSESPTHLIHFNGERFLGPHR